MGNLNSQWSSGGLLYPQHKTSSSQLPTALSYNLIHFSHHSECQFSDSAHSTAIFTLPLPCSTLLNVHSSLPPVIYRIPPSAFLLQSSGELRISYSSGLEPFGRFSLFLLTMASFLSWVNWRLEWRSAHWWIQAVNCYKPSEFWKWRGKKSKCIFGPISGLYKESLSLA